jgi:hypothetical protein
MLNSLIGDEIKNTKYGPRARELKMQKERKLVARTLTDPEHIALISRIIKVIYV